MRSLHGDLDGADRGLVGSVGACCKDGERGDIFPAAIASGDIALLCRARLAGLTLGLRFSIERDLSTSSSGTPRKLAANAVASGLTRGFPLLLGARGGEARFSSSASYLTIDLKSCPLLASSTICLLRRDRCFFLGLTEPFGLRSLMVNPLGDWKSGIQALKNCLND